MPREMKVYGEIMFMRQPDDVDEKWYSGTQSRAGREMQVRVIVAAQSFAAANRALEAADMSKFHRDYCSDTGNPEELAAALAEPGTVFAQIGRFGPFKRARGHRYVD